MKKRVPVEDVHGDFLTCVHVEGQTVPIFLCLLLYGQRYAVFRKLAVFIYGICRLCAVRIIDRAIRAQRIGKVLIALFAKQQRLFSVNFRIPAADLRGKSAGTVGEGVHQHENTSGLCVLQKRRINERGTVLCGIRTVFL